MVFGSLKVLNGTARLYTKKLPLDAARRLLFRFVHVRIVAKKNKAN